MNAWKYTVLFTFFVCAAPALRGEGDPWADRSNVALSFLGAEAIIRDGSGVEHEAGALVNGLTSDESAVLFRFIPAEIIVTLPSLTSVEAVRLFPGYVAAAENPSGECGIRDYALHGFFNGGWVPLIKPVRNARALLDTPFSPAGFHYLHTFPPRSIEKLRLTVTRSGDTGRRLSSPHKPIVPEGKKISYLRAVEVYAAKSADPPLRHISRLIEADFRLPVWRNRDQASLWVYPTRSFREAADIEIAFLSRDAHTVPGPPLRVRLDPDDQPLKASIPTADWPDGDYLTSIRIVSPDGADSGELVRLLRKQTVPEPSRPPESVDVRGRALLMVDDWHLAEQSGTLAFRVHPAKLFPVTQGPLAPNRVYQGGHRLTVRPDGTVSVVFWDKDRREGDKQWHTAVSSNLRDWSFEDGRHPHASRPASPTAPAPARTRTTPPAPAAPKPEVICRFYSPDDGPVNLEQVRLRWVGFKATTLGDIPAPARSTWPIWNKSTTERIVLTREPLMVCKGLYGVGEFDTWRDSNDNSGGQWLSRDRRRLYYVRARTPIRFDPFRVPYDNLRMVSRILAVWSTTNGLDWTTTWLSQPDENDPFTYQHYGMRSFSVENGGLRLAYLFAYDQVSQQIWIELNYSRDGLLWKRFPGQPAFAANGPPGSWNFGMMFTTHSGVPHGDHMLHLLNNCYKGVHFYGLPIDPSKVTAESLQRRYATRSLAERWPFFEEVGGWRGLAHAIGSNSKTLGIMRFRRDGWASLRADGEAVAVTRLLEAGPAAAMNARTDPGGFIAVDVLGADGAPLPDYSGDHAAVFRGDATRHPLTWKGGTINALPGRPVRLRFRMRDADLFALHL